MNFFEKKVYLNGEFTEFRNADFKVIEMEFLLSQLGAIITTVNKADIIIIGDNADKEKFSSIKADEVEKIKLEKLEDMILQDEIELADNPELLKKIQKQLVFETPKYLGRNVMNEHVIELLKEKISQVKISKAWIKQFYENIFISNVPKEELIAEYGSPKAKEFGLDWILTNHSFKDFYKNKLPKMKEVQLIQNDVTFSEKIIKDKIEKAFSRPFYFENLRYLKYLSLNDRKKISVWINIEFKERFTKIGEVVWLLLCSSKKDGREKVRFLEDRDLILSINEKLSLADVNKKFQDDEEIVMHFIKLKGENFEFASDRLKNDFTIAVEAIKRSDEALKFASSELLKNRDFIKIFLSLTSFSSSLLYKIQKVIHEDRELALLAVKNAESFNTRSFSRRTALSFFSPKIRNDREIVIEAINKYPNSLEDASNEFKNDRSIVSLATDQDERCLDYASSEIKRDKNFVLPIIKRKGFVLKYIDELLRDDYELVMEAVKSRGEALKYASSRLQNTKEIIVAAVSQDGSIFKDLSKEHKADSDIVFGAFTNWYSALFYADPVLKNDPDFMSKCIKENNKARDYLPKALKI